MTIRKFLRMRLRIQNIFCTFAAEKVFKHNQYHEKVISIYRYDATGGSSVM